MPVTTVPSSSVPVICVSSYTSQSAILFSHITDFSASSNVIFAGSPLSGVVYPMCPISFENSGSAVVTSATAFHAVLAAVYASVVSDFTIGIKVYS